MRQHNSQNESSNRSISCFREIAQWQLDNPPPQTEEPRNRPVLETGRSPVGRPLLPADCRGHRGRGWMQPVRRCILLTATSSVPASRISSRPSPILAAWADHDAHWHGAGIMSAAWNPAQKCAVRSTDPAAQTARQPAEEATMPRQPLDG